MEEERKYITLAFATDDVAASQKDQFDGISQFMKFADDNAEASQTPIELGEEHDDFEKLRQEFGASFDPGPNRPHVFLNRPIEEDNEFTFINFDDEDVEDEKTFRYPFLENIKSGIAVNRTVTRILVITGLFVAGCVLVRCVRRIVT